MNQEVIPSWRPVPPQIPKQIHHHDGAHEGGIPQGQPANGAEMLFELGRHAGPKREVATVMRPRSDLIDQQGVVLKKKQFHRHDSAVIKRLCEGNGKFLRA
jgi:hypothetical protein